MFLLFIDNKDIIEKGMPVIPMLCIAELFDILQSILCAVMKALGKNVIASVLTFIQFYLIMTSMSYLLGNVLNWGVYGMWTGIAIGQGSAFLLYLILFLCLDLKKAKIEIRRRLANDSKKARADSLKDEENVKDFAGIKNDGNDMDKKEDLIKEDESSNGSENTVERK